MATALYFLNLPADPPLAIWSILRQVIKLSESTDSISWTKGSTPLAVTQIPQFTLPVICFFAQSTCHFFVMLRAFLSSILNIKESYWFFSDFQRIQICTLCHLVCSLPSCWRYISCLTFQILQSSHGTFAKFQPNGF